MSNPQRDEIRRVKTAVRSLPDIQVSDLYKDLKAIGLVADNSACGYYRIILPLHMLKMHGAQVCYTSFHQGDAFRYYDNIIAPRQHNLEVLDIYRHAGWEGKNLIYEIDDDLHHVEPSNPAYGVYHYGTPECRAIPEFLKASDGWTTTTPELARLYYQHNQNPAIIGNFIDFSIRDWGVDVTWENGQPIFNVLPIQKPKEWVDKIVIGWSGGTSHKEDLEQIGHPIRRILETNDNVLFAFYGSQEMYEWIISTYKIPRDKTSYVPARHFLDYPSGLHGFDISLAPITCNQFNLCKSDLRILEMSAVGSACIASNVGPYSRWHQKHPETVILVGNSPRCVPSWQQAIQELIDNPEKRQSLQKLGREVVIKNYSLEANFHRWPQAWAAIAERKYQGILGPDPEKRAKDWYTSYGKVGRNDLCPCGSGLTYKNCHLGGWG